MSHVVYWGRFSWTIFTRFLAPDRLLVLCFFSIKECRKGLFLHVLVIDCGVMQRDRKGQTSIHQLSDYFHLPINVAGRELSICPTVLKKICRRHGLQRWPHRKVRFIADGLY